jgi:hypothetical protein
MEIKKNNNSKTFNHAKEDFFGGGIAMPFFTLNDLIS